MARKSGDTRSVLDSSVFLACQFDLKTLKITTCSPGLAGALGDFNSTYYIGRYLIDIISPDSLDAIETLLTSSQGEGFAACRLVDDNGNQIDVSVAIEKWASESGRSATLICLPELNQTASFDKLVAAEREASRRTEVVSDLTRLLVHDVKGALQVIQGSVELVQLRGDSLSSKVIMDLARMQRAVNGVNTLLDEVSKYMRYDIGEFPTELTDMNDLVDKVIAEYERIPDRQTIIRRVGSLPMICCARPLIRQVIHNLLDNAVLYADTDPTVVTIGTREEDDTGLIFVKDNGVGIRPEDRERVFRPLERCDHRKLNDHGTGMGLPQVKKIIERHRGRLWLESELDVGTTVWFSIEEHNP